MVIDVKLLIVSNDKNWSSYITDKLQEGGRDIMVISASEDEALSVFRAESPHAVLVSEYAPNEYREGGELLFKRLKSCAAYNQVVVRAGLIPLSYYDYMKHPIDTDQLCKLIQNQRKQIVKK